MAAVPNTGEGPLSVLLATDGETLVGATSSALLAGSGDLIGGVVWDVAVGTDGGPIVELESDAATELVVVLVVVVDDTAVALLLKDSSSSFFTSTGVSDLDATADGFEDCCIVPGEGVGVGVRTMVVSPTCCTGLGANRFCSSAVTFLVVTVTLMPVCTIGATVETGCEVTGSRFTMVMFVVSPMLDAELTDTAGALDCNWLPPGCC